MKETEIPHTNPELIFLKLGGSLITDKQNPRTAREELIQDISLEIATIIKEISPLQLVLGHGSGSFGHYSGKKHLTRQGVKNLAEWRGFTEVWHDAASLNKLVMDSLKAADLPVISFPPSASVIANNRRIIKWDLTPIETALDNQLIPVVYGDVIFDSQLGGTILSTEDLFVYLAQKLKPRMILLAGEDQGVWEDYPTCRKLIPEISPTVYPSLVEKITPSDAPDVTGGMQDKVDQMLKLIKVIPDLEVVIFSGQEKGNIIRALNGEALGTRIIS